MNSENISECSLPSSNLSFSTGSSTKFTPVVLVCINNVGFNHINHELLNSVFSTYGKINRILIFEKSKKIKAFIEFAEKKSAVDACEQLDNFLLFNDGTRMNTYPSNLSKIVFQNNNTGGIDYTVFKEPMLKRNISADFSMPKNHSQFRSSLSGSFKPDGEIHEDCNRSTSTSTWTKAGSGHDSNDEDKEDELLKMIESHHKDMRNQEDEDKLSDDENEKDGFNKLVQDAFFHFPPKCPPSSRSTSNPRRLASSKSFPPTLEENSPTFLKRLTKEAEPFIFNSSKENASISHAVGHNKNQNEDGPDLSNRNMLYHYHSLPEFTSNMNRMSAGQFLFDDQRLHHSSSFDRSMDETHRNIYDAEFEKILKSQEMQKMGGLNNKLDYGCLNQLSKDSLTQLYDNLSAMLGKEGESKKSAVLHVNGLENKDIKVGMIYNIFSNFGNVLKIIYMRNKSSALIEFENTEYSTIAREYLNNIVFMGKTLRISFSNYANISIRNKQISKGNSEEVFLGNPKLFRFKKNKMISINPPSSTLHLSNLVKEACLDDSLIKKTFSQFGKIEAMRFLFGDKGKNMCLIRMNSIEESLKAVAYLHDTEFFGRKIQISFTRSKI